MPGAGHTARGARGGNHFSSPLLWRRSQPSQCPPAARSAAQSVAVESTKFVDPGREAEPQTHEVTLQQRTRVHRRQCYKYRPARGDQRLLLPDLPPPAAATGRARPARHRARRVAADAGPPGHRADSGSPGRRARGEGSSSETRVANSMDWAEPQQSVAQSCARDQAGLIHRPQRLLGTPWAE